MGNRDGCDLRFWCAQFLCAVVLLKYCHCATPCSESRLREELLSGLLEPKRSRSKRGRLQKHAKSREGNPSKKPPNQIQRVCTNSLRKLFLAVFCLFCRKKGGTGCANCSAIACTMCFYLGGFFFFGVGLPCMTNERKRAQMSANASLQKSANERKRAQKSASALNCKQPGLKQPG